MRLGKSQETIENAWDGYGGERVYCSWSTLHIKQGWNGEILIVSTMKWWNPDSFQEWINLGSCLCVPESPDEPLGTMRCCILLCQKHILDFKLSSAPTERNRCNAHCPSPTTLLLSFFSFVLLLCFPKMCCAGNSLWPLGKSVSKFQALLTVRGMCTGIWADWPRAALYQGRKEQRTKHHAGQDSPSRGPTIWSVLSSPRHCHIHQVIGVPLLARLLASERILPGKNRYHVRWRHGNRLWD